MLSVYDVTDQQEGKGRAFETDRVSRSTALALLANDSHAGTCAGHGIQTLIRQTCTLTFPEPRSCVKVEADVGRAPRP